MSDLMLMTVPITGMKADSRRAVEITRLLDWAYRLELTKAAQLGLTYNAQAKIWELGTRIDTPMYSGSGTFYESLLDCGNPHEDALLVHETVSELDTLSPDWHEEDVADMLLGDMPKEIQIAASRAIADYKPSRTATVVSHAKMGARPLWRCDTPERKQVTGPNGKPLWVVDREIITDGAFGAVHVQHIEEPCRYSKKKALPPNARPKMEWEPSLRSVVTRRADYCHWHASLTWLAEELQGKLLSWNPSPPAVSALPWIDGEAQGPRVLPTLARAA